VLVLDGCVSLVSCPLGDRHQAAPDTVSYAVVVCVAPVATPIAEILGGRTQVAEVVVILVVWMFTLCLHQNNCELTLRVLLTALDGGKWLALSPGCFDLGKSPMYRLELQETAILVTAHILRKTRTHWFGNSSCISRSDCVMMLMDKVWPWLMDRYPGYMMRECNNNNNNSNNTKHLALMVRILRSRVQISSQRLIIFIEDFVVFLSLEKCQGSIEIRPWLFPFISFQIHYSLTVCYLDAIYSGLETASLNNTSYCLYYRSDMFDRAVS
jgi:hypothetical protein